MTNFKPQPTWPDAISKFGDVMPTVEDMRAAVADQSDIMLCANGLSAWGCCALETPPKSFGMFMVVVGERLGISPLGDNLMVYSDNFLSNRENNA